MVRVQTSGESKFTAAGFFISPLHVITSSQCLLEAKIRSIDDKTVESVKWLLDSQKADRNTCDETTKVPNKYRRELRVFWNTTIIQQNDKVYSYGFSHDNNDVTFVNTKTTIKEIDQGSINVEKTYRKGNRGGPLIKNETLRGAIAIGIDGTSGFDDKARNAYHTDIRSLQKRICELTRVCSESVSTEPTTTVTPSTINLPRGPTSSEGVTNSGGVTQKRTTEQYEEYEENPDSEEGYNSERNWSARGHLVSAAESKMIKLIILVLMLFL
ncbi:Protein CBG12787 [Caenorhabditis briggsae]|uniref:Peptidase S1 domain-containing protein n=2 Tax=Caenorhabditis briggsae TaxID=6238 RepID=A0AAE9DVR7_CAEBR|nr:Protein CBG12787 [Caenorhabditis briggsae]ULU13053.1 hypothetical protein L3Y34_015918 [Caenorhabditis briggsae]CAP31709.2 Protein CBG12787 [Caenorhabditis briggsae]